MSDVSQRTTVTEMGSSPERPVGPAAALRTALGPGPGSLLVRRLLPAVVVALLIVASILFAGEEAGWYGARGEAELTLASVIAALTIALFWSAYRLNRAAAERAAAAALRHRLAAIVDAAEDAIWSKTPDGIITSWNPAAERLLGYRAGEIVGRPVGCLLPDDRLEEEMMILGRVGQGERIPPFETVRRHRDGALVPVSVSVSPIRGEDGAIVGVSTILHDLTERQRAEEVRRQSARELEIRNRIAEVFLTVPDDNMYHEVLAIVLEAMNSEYGVFGYVDDKGDLVVPTMTRHIWDQCQVPEKSVVFERASWGDSSWPRALRESRTVHSNHPSATVPDGHVAIRRHISQPIVHHGESIGLLQVANKEGDYDDRDLALLGTIGAAVAPVLHARLHRDRQERERRRAEEEIRILNEELERRVEERTAELTELHERFSGLYSSSKDAIGWADLDGVLLDVNDAFVRLTGYSREELLGKAYGEITPPEYREDEAENVRRTLETGEPGEWEKEYVRKDGTRVPVLLTGFVVRGSTGEAIGVAAIAKDITERKRAEAELRERAARLAAANEELEAFGYSVSHDLRAPLRAIDGFSRALVEDCAESLGAEGLRLLGVIRSSTHAMGELIDDLLAFSRLGRRPPRMASVDMTQLAGEVARQLRDATPEWKGQLQVGALPPAWADRSLLREVFVNLLANAMKFTRPRTEPRVVVGGQMEGDEITYWVRDNGVGFEMQYVDRLFRVFQRLHRSDEFEGTGIGLALVQRIVRKHGGRAWAEGSVGQGATFSIALPREQ